MRHDIQTTDYRVELVKLTNRNKPVDEVQFTAPNIAPSKAAWAQEIATLARKHFLVKDQEMVKKAGDWEFNVYIRDKDDEDVRSFRAEMSISDKDSWIINMDMRPG